VKRFFCAVALALVALSGTAAAQTQNSATRDATREKLRTLLATAGARRDVGVSFRQSEKNPYNFIGVMRDGLTNCDSLEIVIGVSNNDTIGFRVYPHYNGSYVNIDKAKNGPGLMRMLLGMSDENFLFWGADTSGDVFSGYTVTLESGFPEEAIVIVLRSIKNTDGFVGKMRPVIDGSYAPAK
jgi:hypothetical protein